MSGLFLVNDLKSQVVTRRSSIKKNVLTNFAKLTEKYLCPVFFDKDPRWEPSTLLKRDSSTGVFL